MKSVWFRYLPLVLLAVLWEVVARLGLVSTSALPPLSEVVVSWIDLVKTGELTKNGGASLYRAGMGLLLSIVIGAALGIFMAWWKPVNVLLSPLVEIFYPLPKSALIPVTVIWLGFGDGSKILLIFLGCMIPVTIGASTARGRASRRWCGRRAAWAPTGCACCGTWCCRARCRNCSTASAPRWRCRSSCWCRPS